MLAMLAGKSSCRSLTAERSQLDSRCPVTESFAVTATRAAHFAAPAEADYLHHRGGLIDACSQVVGTPVQLDNNRPVVHQAQRAGPGIVEVGGGVRGGHQRRVRLSPDVGDPVPGCLSCGVPNRPSAAVTVAAAAISTDQGKPTYPMMARG